MTGYRKAAPLHLAVCRRGPYDHFQQQPVSALNYPKNMAFIISNPPYGERIEEKEKIFGSLQGNRRGSGLPLWTPWSMCLIILRMREGKMRGRKADQNRERSI